VVEIEPAPGAAAVTARQQYGGQRWDFTTASKRAFMIQPMAAGADGARPWLWYQPTFLGPHPTNPGVNPGQCIYPDDNHTWLFTRLLAQGFWIGGVEIGETYGDPAGRAAQSAFYEAVVAKFGLAPRACLLAQSRGGLMHYNWAVEHAEWVERIGAIYPVTNIRSWLGVASIAQSGYGLTEDEMLRHMHEHNPIERLAPLAAHEVPILHVHGDQDSVVGIEENSLEFARLYRALGGQTDIVIIPGKGHTSDPEFFQSQEMLAFFLAQR